MDYDHLVALRHNHPSWRLLRADNAPLVIDFLHRYFIVPNVRSLNEQELAARLEDYLYHLRQGQRHDPFPRPAREYLNEWAEDTRGWLRRYYPSDSDEPHFDLTPATEQVVQWLSGLEQRQFVGAESRLKQVFDLLNQIVEGSETDPEERIKELERQRSKIDAEIDQIRAGSTAFMMEPTQVRERFLHAEDMARALLADFRQVEQNFRGLDRQIRERIATRDGTKGEILEEVFGERDEIAESDQGRSFRAFWDFLMSPARQEALTLLLEHILELEAVAALRPDPRLRRIHYDWLEAGEVTQRTVARLSEQLRRYLDDQALFENRRIMTIIQNLEQHALAVRDNPPKHTIMSLDEFFPKADLPMDRRLFSPPIKPHITQQVLNVGDSNVSTDILFEQFYVDKNRLRARIRKVLQMRQQVGLSELLQTHPLEQGVAELVAWLSLATTEGLGIIDEERPQVVDWIDKDGTTRRATMPTVIFSTNDKRNQEAQVRA